MAIDVIEKDKKEIRWLGLSNETTNELSGVEVKPYHQCIYHIYNICLERVIGKPEKIRRKAKGPERSGPKGTHYVWEHLINLQFSLSQNRKLLSTASSIGICGVKIVSMHRPSLLPVCCLTLILMEVGRIDYISPLSSLTHLGIVGCTVKCSKTGTINRRVIPFSLY